MKTYFIKIGSNDGSISSSIFSINTDWPNLIEFSRVFKKLLSLNLVTWRFESFPKVLIHLLAYPWGSITNGHLLQLKINIPLSIDKLSAGNPASYHSLIVTSSTKILCNEKLSDTGMFYSLQFPIHFFTISTL